MAVHYNDLPKSVQKAVDKQHPDVHYKDDDDTSKAAPAHSTKPVAPHVHAEPEKKLWTQTFKQRVMGAASSAGKALGNLNEKVQERHRDNPLVHGESKGTKKPRHSPGQSQHTDLRRVASRDVYKNGVKVETIHYAAVHSKQAKAPKKERRPDPLGGLGSGMTFRDMLGPMPSSPFVQEPAPRKSKGKKRRAAPRDQGTDFMDHMHNLPKEWRI